MSPTLRTACVICFWAYGLVLLFATHAPADDVAFIVRAADYGLLAPDKLVHVAAYGLLGLLAALAYGGRWRTMATAGAVLFAMLAVWGVLDELTQPMFGRQSDASDWISDLVGIALGLAVGLVAERRLTGRLRSAA